jgi:hypothetical protein
MPTESLMESLPKSHQRELLDIAEQLCKLKLGETLLTRPASPNMRLDLYSFRNEGFEAPIEEGLVVIARFRQVAKRQKEIAVATYDFMYPDFPMRMQVRASHPTRYYDSDYFAERLEEINGYLDNPDKVYAQGFYLNQSEDLKV